MKRHLIILIGAAAMLPGCSSMKAPLSISLYSPSVTDQKVTFKTPVELRVDVAAQDAIFRKHSSGYVGSAVEFNFDLGHVLPGLTRDALSDVFQDVVFVRGQDGNATRERLSRSIVVSYRQPLVKFELSYASNKFDKGSFSGQAQVVVRDDKGRSLFDKVLSLKGEYSHDNVGGDAGSIDRALSMAVSRMVGDLKSDVAFASLFDAADAAGDAPVTAEGSIEEKLERLRALREKGLITVEDYEKARAKVLGDLVGK